MSILVDRETRLLIQGITGTEGSRACKESLRYGTTVVAGVTPGKSGANVEGVPVYGSVEEACKHHPGITASLIVVPAPHARAAALEAIEAKIPIITIVTEHVPTYDTACIVAAARAAEVQIIGPSSVGIISPGKGKIGSIGLSLVEVFSPGPVGLISKSGGMTSEIALALTRAGFGQSTALGIGADVIIGSDFADLLALFGNDEETKAIVLFGEVGGVSEEKAAEYLESTRFPKPVVALVAGAFSDRLPEDTVLGHAGAIVSRGRGSYASKVSSLREAGVHVVERVEDIPVALKTIL